jgi:hypothetical protein
MKAELLSKASPKYISSVQLVNDAVVIVGYRNDHVAILTGVAGLGRRWGIGHTNFAVCSRKFGIAAN